jgi:ferric-dicitrate binding protein FerR (iron transport regulator)
MKTPQDFQDLLDRFVRGECTPAEEQLVLTWYENIGQEQADDIDIREEFRVVIEAKIWARLQNQLKNSKPPRSFYWRGVAAAVVAVLLVGVGLLSFKTTRRGILAIGDETATAEPYTTVANTEATSKLVLLDDGTRITLQPHSEIRYRTEFKTNREVFLRGEAFFDVKRDEQHPFRVYSSDVVTRVLGTSFTIKAYDQCRKVTVAVRTGRVSVYKKEDDVASNAIREKDELILVPNQQAEFDLESKLLSKKLVEKPIVVLSKPTLLEMEYDGAPVVKILKVLEENYGVDIQFNEAVLAHCALTTSLHDEGLFERINIICEAHWSTLYC